MENVNEPWLTCNLQVVSAHVFVWLNAYIFEVHFDAFTKFDHFLQISEHTKSKWMNKENEKKKKHTSQSICYIRHHLIRAYFFCGLLSVILANKHYSHRNESTNTILFGLVLPLSNLICMQKFCNFTMNLFIWTLSVAAQLWSMCAVKMRLFYLSTLTENTKICNFVQFCTRKWFHFDFNSFSFTNSTISFVQFMIFLLKHDVTHISTWKHWTIFFRSPVQWWSIYNQAIGNNHNCRIRMHCIYHSM